MDDCRWSIIIYFWNLTIPVGIYTPFLHRADSLILKYHSTTFCIILFPDDLTSWNDTNTGCINTQVSSELVSILVHLCDGEGAVKLITSTV